MSALGCVCRGIIWAFFKSLHVFYIPQYITRIFRKPLKCPPVTNPIFYYSAAELAQKIRQKELSSFTVVKTYIDRIIEVNPVINALVDERFEEAINEAKAVDEIIAKGGFEFAKKPLLGVPLTVKESIAVKGLSNRAGCKFKKELKAQEDAEVVALARKAGAIPLLVSNTPELCMNWETFNKVTGTTRNPYDTRRTPGGSSGGEATLLASAASIIGLGSDICGSLRLPAHFCGVYGHKPSPGVVSSKGHYPDCTDKVAWKHYFTLGPMARYAEDLPLMLGTIGDPDMLRVLELDKEVDVRKLRIFYVDGIEATLLSSMNREVSGCINRLVKFLESSRDKKVVKPNLEDLPSAVDYTFVILARIRGVDHISDSKLSAWKAVLRYLTFTSDYDGLTVAYGIVRQLAWGIIPNRLRDEAEAIMERLRTRIVELLGDDGVLLLPSFTGTAHPHNDILKKVFDTTYLAMFNVMGLPVTNCPVGVSNEGLPIGVQVVAGPNCDRLCFAVAKEIEKGFGGWIPPHLIKNRKSC